MSLTLNAAIAAVGIDIGKNSFHIVGHDERGAIVLRQKWSRGQVFVATNNQWAISVPLFPQGSSHLGEPPSPAPQELDRHRPLIS